MPVSLSEFARSLSVETAFSVLAIARQLKAAGKDVVELEIGDSPFSTPPAAQAAGIRGIEGNQTHYCPSPGLPEFRAAAAAFVSSEFGIPAKAENIVVAPGAKVFEQYFCEAFLNPGDSVLVFSPHFPTYLPNIQRRGATAVLCPLRQETSFRPQLEDVKRFLTESQSPRGIFLNSPHNPTGGVATLEDLQGLADLIRGRDIAVFSDEPYCHMVWQGAHHSLLAQPGMLDQCVGAYTFSKSYSMSGWRLGFAVASTEVAGAIGKMINTTLSCTPPFIQLAGLSALQLDRVERDRQMAQFQKQVELLAAGVNTIPGFKTLPPTATFYVFPNVAPVCNRLGITSHGLAMFLLEGADDGFGVACLGGECFGTAGHGFLRLSCAEAPDRLTAAVDFLSDAVQRTERARAYLESHPHYRLAQPYPETDC
ncbi:pyridoxal phosphate-dependent aminotransferase [Planctomicrobium piriforme]|uniref:Aspartate aminotransferase n=1 Tax=Planctomicrobium piriforme TaxID=1576369 RepID=A0A1I3RQI0_9PLAN|nr:aminotransferase class I/II-fold pyridoxal phosphate-dependent enzyme [Planctomicrobium piriforme]SFJ47456.1 aspartate aminotransferase [Planctomicrobium piriforme]